jgi:hypothetical protein
MKRDTCLVFLTLLLSLTGVISVWAEEPLPPKLQQLTEEVNEAENIHKEQFGDERLQALLQNDLGDARQTSETIHRAVEEFVGDAEPSDDLTKMCIKMR